MRYLLLTRGMPFCGKSEWIAKHNLQDYTLSLLDFKRLLVAPSLSESGRLFMDFSGCEKAAFAMLFSALESRMSRGEFIVIKDNHISKSYFSNYKEIAKTYNYRILIVDFSDVGLDEIKKRNAYFSGVLDSKHLTSKGNFRFYENTESKNKDSKKLEIMESNMQNSHSHFLSQSIPTHPPFCKINTKSANANFANNVNENIESRFYENAESKNVENQNKKDSIDSKSQNSQLRDSYQSIPARPPICKTEMNLSTANFADNVNENIESRFYESNEIDNLDSKNNENSQDNFPLDSMSRPFPPTENLKENYPANFANAQDSIESKNKDSKNNQTHVENEKNIESTHEKVYTNDELDALYDELKNGEIPIKCDVIAPDEVTKMLTLEPKSLNGYKVIHHIGDIQGSFAVLKKYIQKIKDNEFYIFLGDYIDRGFQNYEVLRFLISIMDKKNVVLLEGNHEKWLNDWANNRDIDSREFRLNTQVELESKGFSKADAKRFYNKLLPFFFYRFHDKRILCTHGGLSNMPRHLLLLSANQCIHGVGGYLNTNAVAASFSKNTPKNYYQFFGHRNKSELPIRIHERNFIMESKVEFGGFLRIVQLSQNGFKDCSLRNAIFVSKEQKDSKVAVQKYFDSLEKHNTRVTFSRFKNMALVSYPAKISSDVIASAFGFSPCVVDEKEWAIVARGFSFSLDFNKKFALDLNSYLDSIKLPLRIYSRTRGIPAFISYYKGEFFYFLDSILQQNLPLFLQQKSAKKALGELLKKGNFTLHFVLDSKNSFILQDVFCNASSLPQFELVESVARVLNVAYNECVFMFESLGEYKDFLKTLRAFNADLSKSLDLDSMQSLESNFLESKLPKSTNSIILNEYKFSPLIAFDNVGGFTTLPMCLNSECNALLQMIKIWKLQGEISKLQWINNAFRERFFAWFVPFSNENEWKNIPNEWIINKFLESIESRFYKNTESKHDFTTQSLAMITNIESKKGEYYGSKL
ncbi:serine/threonine protein phosphatase [Helicobacter saguini]|uniref:Serine/threonine protein phosphatase n=1 Tax=Helicobacter saguini TaxID=1548018 RepID=A0A347VXI8_9HELI|nr:metallophosphoesterase [Helicobacter saguini]MWV61617.1 serine/threonine protein phosphatase [Helicobacter saguini]MWV67711.1 serine/threonine protein phosphatase [Helicobacter saguini]MWV70063.1 serine/threonine protein phosphatase [Helicobacter saguini]MWV72724.1 serine/threonine protein phosphatase [Helicobacter saguini]TLD92013.1 serine/threonine protein phosphatase [Helicobacter saguini]